MTPFKGFSEEVFECCDPSEKIRTPINILKESRLEIEPELRKLNPALIGHVSRTKKQGTNKYQDWAWLYFNTRGVKAYRYSQLTVNISPTRLYVGVNIRTHPECLAFRKQIEKEEYRLLFERILKSLSGREWIIPMGGEWEKRTPRRYSVEEVRGLLLDPQLDWINACFERNEPMLRTQMVANEIVQIFKELYNVFALASGNQTIRQPGPKYGIFKQEMSVDSAELESPPKTDESSESETRQFLLTLKTIDKLDRCHLPERRDQYSVKRRAVELNLTPHQFDFEGETVTVYSNQDIKPFRDEILRNYHEFSKRLNQVGELLHLSEGFLKIMFVDPKSDARYHMRKGSSSIFLNLARFRANENLFFWLFSVSRELAYIKAHRLGYHFINQLRAFLTFALNNFQAQKAANACARA
jgi:hypothetical protein